MNSLSEREKLENQVKTYDFLVNILPIGVVICAIAMYFFQQEGSTILFTLPVIGDVKLYEFIFAVVLIDCLIGTLVLRNMRDRAKARISQI